MKDQTPNRSRAALKRLLIVLASAVVFVIFSYGWAVTDIDLSVPQQPQRQQNVGNALRELLSPNVFVQDYDIRSATTPVQMGCPDGFIQPEPSIGTEPVIVVTPACANSGDVVTVQGYNFQPDSLARVNWIATDGERRTRQVNGTRTENFTTDSSGGFSVQIEVPRIRGSAGETHTVEAQGRFAVGTPRLSNTTQLVLEKMVETIFLALIATAISILPSAILSFFAAHNLMQPVRMPLGSLLVSVTLLPIGWLIGALLLSPIGTTILDLGRNTASAQTAGVGLFLFAAVASADRLRRNTANTTPSRGREVLNTVLVAVAAIALIALVGRLGILAESAFTDGVLGYVGTFLGSIGELIELLIVPLAGIIGAFTLSSIGTQLTRDALKHVSVSVSHILGAVLGAVAGALLMLAMAVIGMGAAWLGLMAPIAAAGLAMPLLPTLYRQFISRSEDSLQPGRIDRSMLAALAWIGAIAAFVITYSVLNVQRSLVEGTLPAQVPALTIGEFTIYRYMLNAIIIGAVLGGITSGLAGTKSVFPIGNVLYNVTRTTLNALRSIEPLIMGLVFVIWVGIGPFAGVLALALHSIASLGKLYSEQIENIDSGPIEALQSTGANRLQTIMYAVVPQIIPPYIAFTMYRWDINVRMSTIIGFVGGGGIGFLLQQQINLLRYRDAGVAVVAIAIVVSILDYASAAIRQRYT